MIKAAKDILTAVVKQQVPDAVIVRSAAEEKQAIMARKWPLVGLITNPGNFDDTDAQVVRYYDETDQVYKERYIRGSRILPILLRLWAEGEDTADELFSAILPAIPSRFQHDDFTGSIRIEREEHSDHAGNVTKLYCSVAVIQFSLFSALKADVCPVTIDTVDMSPSLE